MSTNKEPEYYDLTTEVDVPKPIRFATSSDKSLIIPPPTRRAIREIREANNGEGSNRALFGESYDAIVAHFDELPVQHWDSFMNKVNAHFFGSGADETPGKSQA